MAFSLNETTLISAVKSGSILSIVNSTLSPGYGIYYATTQPGSLRVVNSKALSGISVFSVEPSSSAVISNAPIEKGSYSSYNKVQRPGELRMVFTFEGWTGFSGAIPNLTNFTLNSRSDILAELEEMKNSTNTYDIETPDTVYTTYDLVGYDYKVSAKDGVTLLTVNALFQDVMDVAEVTLTSTTAKKDMLQYSDDHSNSVSGVCTVKVPSSAGQVTLSDVQKSLAGLKGSISSALTSTAGSVTSSLQSAATSVSQPLLSSVSSGSDQLAEGISKLVGSLT